MSLKWPEKDPDETLDYRISWSARLAGDTIASSEWTVPSGMTKESDSNTNTATTIWLSGGTDKQTYSIVNHIVTAEGRVMEQTVRIRVKSR